MIKLLERSIKGLQLHELKNLYKAHVLDLCALYVLTNAFEWINVNLREKGRITPLEDEIVARLIRAALAEMTLALGNSVEILAKAFEGTPISKGFNTDAMKGYGISMRRRSIEVLRERPGEKVLELQDELEKKIGKPLTHRDLLWVPEWFGRWGRPSLGDELINPLNNTRIILRHAPSPRGTPWRRWAVSRIRVPNLSKAIEHLEKNLKRIEVGITP